MEATITEYQKLTELHQFLQTVQEDVAFHEQLKAATSSGNLCQILVELGKEQGYIFTDADIHATLEAEMAFEEVDLREKESTNDNIVARVCRCSRSFSSANI